MQECNICNSTTYKNLYFGNWFSYCDRCIKKGKQENWEMDYDNIIKPSLDDGDFSMIDGELAESMIENL